MPVTSNYSGRVASVPPSATIKQSTWLKRLIKKRLERSRLNQALKLLREKAQSDQEFMLSDVYHLLHEFTFDAEIANQLFWFNDVSLKITQAVEAISQDKICTQALQGISREVHFIVEAQHFYDVLNLKSVQLRVKTMLTELNQQLATLNDTRKKDYELEVRRLAVKEESLKQQQIQSELAKEKYQYEILKEQRVKAEVERKNFEMRIRFEEKELQRLRLEIQNRNQEMAQERAKSISEDFLKQLSGLQ